MQLEAARFYVISRQGLTVLAAGTFVHVSLVQVLMLELVPVAAVGQWRQMWQCVHAWQLCCNGANTQLHARGHRIVRHTSKM